MNDSFCSLFSDDDDDDTLLDHLLTPAKRCELLEFELKITEFLITFRSILSDEKAARWKAERARVRRMLKEKPKKTKKTKASNEEERKVSQSKKDARRARAQNNVVQQPRK